MPGKQDGPSRIIYGPSRPPWIAQNAHFFTLGPIYEKPVIIFFPCYKFICSVLWGLTALKFSFTWVRRKAPPGPPRTPQIWKKKLFFHNLGLNLKMSYQIASLFHMYIDMGERIAWKQDRPSLIIEDPLRAPKIPPKYTFFLHFGPIN